MNGHQSINEYEVDLHNLVQNAEILEAYARPLTKFWRVLVNLYRWEAPVVSYYLLLLFNVTPVFTGTSYLSCLALGVMVVVAMGNVFHKENTLLKGTDHEPPTHEEVVEKFKTLLEKLNRLTVQLTQILSKMHATISFQDQESATQFYSALALLLVAMHVLPARFIFTIIMDVYLLHYQFASGGLRTMLSASGLTDGQDGHCLVASTSQSVSTSSNYSDLWVSCNEEADVWDSHSQSSEATSPDMSDDNDVPLDPVDPEFWTPRSCEPQRPSTSTYSESDKLSTVKKVTVGTITDLPAKKPKKSGEDSDLSIAPHAGKSELNLAQGESAGLGQMEVEAVAVASVEPQKMVQGEGGEAGTSAEGEASSETGLVHSPETDDSGDEAVDAAPSSSTESAKDNTESSHSAEPGTSRASGVMGKIMEFRRNKVTGNCSGCSQSFSTIFKRKRLCASCGNNYCARCCFLKLEKRYLGVTAPEGQHDLVLVCADCYNTHHPAQQ